jgi:REP element-mobilizing transposase RayT
MHSVKSYTANSCNKLLGQSGRFWQQESYDHCVRDEEELARIFDYIELNPVKAGLCRVPAEWRYSSAYERAHPVG